MRTSFLLVLAIAFSGCGGPLSQPAARDLAVVHACDWLQKCGEIGAGKSYATRDSCEVSQRSEWNARWPLAKCDGKILPSDLDPCLRAVDATVCGNVLDLLNTLFNKCSQTQVCKG